MSFGKFCIVVVFLLVSAGQSQAQWRANPWEGATNPGFPGANCRDYAVRVEDARGVAIMGAQVVPEDSAIPITTDANGVAHLPCRAVDGFMPRLEVTAQGYRPVTVTLTPDYGTHQFPIRLDRNEPVSPAGGSTVDIAELSVDTQKRSARLLDEAVKALRAKKYDSAEILLTEARKLTPSSAPIMNNLGIVALHRNDLDSAAEWFQKAAEAAPHDGQIRGNFGMVCWMQNRPEESYRSLIKASALGYESNLGNYILGVLGLGKGEFKQSVKLLKKVPTDRFPYRDLYLSIALHNCGKHEAAKESYHNFLERNPAPLYTSLLQ